MHLCRGLGIRPLEHPQTQAKAERLPSQAGADVLGSPLSRSTTLLCVQGASRPWTDTELFWVAPLQAPAVPQLPPLRIPSRGPWVFQQLHVLTSDLGPRVHRGSPHQPHAVRHGPHPSLGSQLPTPKGRGWRPTRGHPNAITRPGTASGDGAGSENRGRGAETLKGRRASGDAGAKRGRATAGGPWGLGAKLQGTAEVRRRPRRSGSSSRSEAGQTGSGEPTAGVRAGVRRPQAALEARGSRAGAGALRPRLETADHDLNVDPAPWTLRGGRAL